MAERLIFLDIDGVLVNGDSLGRGVPPGPTLGEHFCSYPSAECMDQMNRLVRDANCEVVLSSTWRLPTSKWRTMVRTQFKEGFTEKDRLKAMALFGL